MVRKLGLALVVILLSQAFLEAQTATQPADPMIVKLQAFTPQRILDLNKPPRKVRIQYVRADLEGTGKFDLILAVYLAQAGGKIRVLRDVSGSLQLAADLDPSKQLDTSGTVGLEIIDIAQTGKPQIEVKSYGSHAQYDLDLLTWTGTSLRSLLPPGGSFENAVFADIDGDGMLEIVTPPSCVDASNPNEICTRTFQVYKFNGTQYALVSTPQTDPTGQISQTGDAQIIFGDARMRPDHFRLEQIHEAVEKDKAGEGDGEEGRLLVRMGNLSAPVDDNPGPRSVTDLDLKSLVLGRNIRPLRARILSADDDPEEQEPSPDHHAESNGTKPVRFQGPFVEARFSRQAVLQFLPRTQLNKALAPGDTLKLDLRGKMKNGAPVFGSVSLKIAAEDEGRHHDKD
jgi:hypothetical protein